MKLLIILLTMVCLLVQNVLASKFMEMRQVDKNYLMLYFKDGKVQYRDDGTGPIAYTGYDFGPAEDKLIAYGKELNVIAVPVTENWIITSNDDQNYTTGLHPLRVYRKSKNNNTDFNWNYKLDHWVYLELPFPMQQEAKYSVMINPEINADVTKADVTFDIFNSVSEAVHVNLIGYTPASAIKSADLYLWIGDGGIRDYHEFEGNQVWIMNAETGEKNKTGTVSFWQKSAREANDYNLTGSDVWITDFTEFRRPGKYRLVIDGVGCSPDFEINNNVFFQPYKFSVRGYYYMRIGEDRMDMVPIPRRPTFIPGKDPEGFTVYITDLDPFDEQWDSFRGDTWDEPHFRPAVKSMFWQRRLPGNPTNPNAFGGHSDALDWDRRLGHVSNIYDMLLPYFLSNGRLNEDDLEIAESGNGIPDLIDEARNEVDMWLRLRYNGGYSQGLTNPSQEKNVMFQAGNTTIAAWANAANCAMMANCFRIADNAELVIYYRDQAIEAFEYASQQSDQQLDELQGIGDNSMRGRDFKMMAAAFLYNVTGDRKWEDMMARESVANDTDANIENGVYWNQTWGAAAYLFTQQERHYPDLYTNMKNAIHRQAFDNNVKYMDIRPSRRSSNNNYFITAHYLHMVILAHALSDNAEEKAKLEQAMVLEVDWGLGRNPSNIVEMTGLGSRHIVNCYTSGINDGTPGMHPGHTPYNNLNKWGDKNDSNPRWFADRCYPDWDKGGWPRQESHFNCRYSWANGEFTPQQTMRGKMALYGYLYALGK